MKQVLYILFGAAFTLAVSLATGFSLLRMARAKLYRGEQYFFGFVLGSACLSLLVFLLTAAHLAYKGVFLAVGIALILSSGVPAGPNQPPLRRFWKIAFVLPYVVFACLYLAHALLPEFSPDGLAYHVSLVARYYRAHAFSRITTNWVANLPQGIEMLFLFAFSFGRHSATAAVHLLFTLAAPLGMLAYARRIGCPAAGVVGALLFYLSPIVGIAGSSAYNDVALACLLFAVFYLLQIWSEERQPALLAPIGLLAGFAFAVKYTGGLAVLYAVGFVTYRQWRSRQAILRPVLTVGFCAGLLMAPWLIKNAIVMANPVTPFANRVFPNPYVYPASEREWIEVAQNLGHVALSAIPLQLTVRGARLNGLIGPMFWLAPLALVALRKKPGRQLLLAGALFALPFPSAIATRFLIPSLIFVSLAMGLTFAPWRLLAAAVILAHAIASWPAVVKRYCDPYTWRIEGIDWKSALRIRPEEEFLRENVPGYNMSRTMERTVPDGQRIYAFQDILSYHTREIIGSWHSAFSIRTRDMMLAPIAAELRPTWRHEFRFPQTRVRKMRLVQTQHSTAELWSMNEIRVLLGGRELPRAPGWRLKAQPNPWEVQLAFDNNPLTRWSSGQAYEPGMFVEIDFGEPTAADQVIVECAHDQPGIRMRLEGDGRLLAAEASIYDAPLPPRLRRAAVEILKHDGFHWLLVHDTDRGARDFLERQRQWGISPVAAQDQFELYRLE